MNSIMILMIISCSMNFLTENINSVRKNCTLFCIPKSEILNIEQRTIIFTN